MVRVDQAGEVGAARIYAGQLAVMGDRARVSGEIRHMAAQEKRHLDAFDALMVKRGVRPTLFAPVWHVAGYALGNDVSEREWQIERGGAWDKGK
jgi:ubiquinone biosynthesis monooxygenase Coq7